MFKFITNSLLFFSILGICIFLVGQYPKTFGGSSDYMAAIIDKHSHAGMIKSPKIILAGGSSVAFGIDSKEIEKAFGLPVINFGLHGGLGLTFILNELRYSIKKGDIVFLTSEYLLENEGENSLKLFASDFFPPARKFYSHNYLVDFKSYLATNQKIFKYLFSAPDKKAQIYSRAAFNTHGDVVSHLDKPSPGNLDTWGRLTYRYWEGINEINMFYEDAKSRNVCVFFLFPNYAASQYEKDKKVITRFERDIRKDLKVEVLNSPADLVYADSLFFDTIYHLNKYGRKKRTVKMIELIEKSTNAQHCVVAARQGIKKMN